MWEMLTKDIDSSQCCIFTVLQHRLSICWLSSVFQSAGRWPGTRWKRTFWLLSVVIAKPLGTRPAVLCFFTNRTDATGMATWEARESCRKKILVSKSILTYKLLHITFPSQEWKLDRLNLISKCGAQRTDITLRLIQHNKLQRRVQPKVHKTPVILWSFLTVNSFYMIIPFEFVMMLKLYYLINQKQ